jgi:hypothetical protein
MGQTEATMSWYRGLMEKWHAPLTG